MMGKKANNSTILARVNFPLYSVQLLTCRHIIVGGGGGTAKTGIANGFEFFELLYDGKNFGAKEILRYETGGNVVMNCAVCTINRQSYLVAGQESNCQLYKVKYLIRSEEIDNSTNHTEIMSNGLRNRYASRTNHNNASVEYCKTLGFEVSPEDNVQTDFAIEEPPLQRVVRISPKGESTVTGGIDGHIRVWSLPSLEQKMDIEAHTKEIDDLDISHDNLQIASVSKDGTAIVWSATTGKKICDLKWDIPDGCKHFYKKCRYSIQKSNPKHNLFIITNLINKIGKKSALIQLWDPTNGHLSKQISVTPDEWLSALAVRNDGLFIAVGSMSGSVLIFTAFGLQVVLSVPVAHSFFVTGLEFIPVPISSDSDSFTTSSEASVISISVDNKICVHSVPYRNAMPFWLFVVIIVCVLMATFCICHFVGL